MINGVIEAADYLRRIGYTGAVHHDAECLTRLHRAHLATVPYENLDIQLGVLPRLTATALGDKIVRRRRGGFCFELNGAFGLLLTALGFRVRYLVAAVNRARDGAGAWGNHLALLVTVDDGTFLADVGFGDGFLSPLPLAIGTYQQGTLTYQLRHDLDGHWRLVHHPGGMAPGFEFRTAPHPLPDFAARCRALASEPTSPYVRTLTVQQPRVDHAVCLRARSLFWQGPSGRRVRELTDRDEFVALLTDEFGLPALPPGDVARLWRRSGAQQEAWRAANA